MAKGSWKYICGLMSGTSLDGLDMALCAFRRNSSQWEYKIVKAVTSPYDTEMRRHLESLPTLSSEKLMAAHFGFGRFLGEHCKEFMEASGLQCDFISSHGHTVFHQPDKGYTFQLGEGSAIAHASGFTTICDFRSADVVLGGQGAPLVPIGDQLLFPEFDACLNIGGFANLSFAREGVRMAYDICAANKILNRYAGLLDQPYDTGGEIAREGQLNIALLHSLNELHYFQLKPPKSLGEEWLKEKMLPLLSRYHDHPRNILRTLTEHIAFQIGNAIKTSGSKKTLVSGGGAYNSFLIEKICEITDQDLIIPENDVVDFKEALIFALMGILRIEGENNILASATGALRDHSSGIIYHP